MSTWNILPAEIQESILTYTKLPCDTHVCRSWHQLAQKYAYRSVEIKSFTQAFYFIDSLHTSGLGQLVRRIIFSEDAMQEIREAGPIQTNVISSIALICRNVIELATKIPGSYRWLLFSNVSVFWSKIEYLPRTNSRFVSYAECAIHFRNLREFILYDGLPENFLSVLLDNFEYFPRLQTIILHYNLSSANIVRLIRERPYLRHVDIQERQYKIDQLLHYLDTDWTDSELGSLDETTDDSDIDTQSEDSSDYDTASENSNEDSEAESSEYDSSLVSTEEEISEFDDSDHTNDSDSNSNSDSFDSDVEMSSNISDSNSIVFEKYDTSSRIYKKIDFVNIDREAIKNDVKAKDTDTVSSNNAESYPESTTHEMQKLNMNKSSSSADS